ncbi:LysM peptidoglycan-binding domain-containing protein [Streptomyces sp. F63]|uniref:BTAD domain-containing putative transcriptional regulator n=1 Tax=Streptomyces sp. F63 TaxID=2824887 RepID=UPI001B35932E|nr:BTAD domain-containing putative transcriptional regulator [Streptomyces sp. F63]MBQ0985883.1 LysM peptidoglycan-binding domain-containing protein [Streptomyces sp. F63]
MNHPIALRQRLSAAATAGGTLAITLALLVGMPCVLWRATGIPRPERVYTWQEFMDRLAQPVSDPLAVDLLAMVGWICWAVFAWTALREICWYAAHLPQLLRDHRVHDEHIAELSFRSSLAALCIGTLIVALLSLWRPPSAGAQQPISAGEARAQFTATAPFIPALDQQTASPRSTPGAASARTTTSDPGKGRTGPKAETGAVRHIEYTVAEGDTLWDIAHAHLGDACKWPRIYALNKDRLQSDGARLSDPDRILPGWRLTIPVPQTATPQPASPHSPDAKAGAPAAPQAEEPLNDTAPGGDTEPGHQRREPSMSASPAQQGDAEAREADTQQGPAAISLGEASLLGITAAAGLLAARRYWYWHRSRLRKPSTESEPQPETPTLSPLVEKAAQAAHAATLHRQPQDPDALIARRTPPQEPRDTGTVTIGVQDNTEVTLDELARPGGCTWSGPGAENAARALLIGILTAAERRRPQPPQVQAVVPEDVAEQLLPGLPPQFTALTQTTDTAQAIQAAERHLITHARAQDEREASADATGATATDPAPAQETGPGTLVLLTAPDAAHLGELQTLAARSNPDTLVVLTLATALPGAETWHITDDGITNRPGTEQGREPAEHLRLYHLTPEAGRDVTEVLLTAHGERPRLRVLPAPSTRPREKHSEATTDLAPEDAPATPPPPAVPQPAQAKPVSLQVLGPITLYARGHRDPIGTNLRPEVHEFLALLAAHPAGLLATDIADKLQLEPDSIQNALKNLRRAVRRALRAATDVTGQEFVLLQGELHKLHPELVETDIAQFSRKMKHALSVQVKDAESEAVSAVGEALAHYRGPFAQGGDYLWADAIREYFATQATDAVLRLARKAEQPGTAPGVQESVLAMLEQLSTIHPDHERLAQHAIRLYQAAGRHDAARHTYTRLKRHLDDLGVEPEPATRALIAPRSHARQTR